jgi:Yip1-like protein
METIPPLATASDAVVAEPARRSVWERAVAIFVRPSAAWSDLATRSQWWFPMMVTVLLGSALLVPVYERAVVPDQLQRYETMAEQGRIPAAQLEQMEQGMRGPVGLAIGIVGQAVFRPVLFLFVALLLWFGVGFVLGAKFRYRHALEVATWSSLVLIPTEILHTALAWGKQSMMGVHTGLGILVPESDPPTKLQVALAAFLDALGPFSVWWIAVTVIGAAALSGAPRKSVAWVVCALYLAVCVFLAAMAAMFTPAA